MSEKGTDARAGETQLAEICVRNSTTLERGLVLLPGLPSPAAIFRDSCAGFATSESADLRSFVSSKLSGVASTRSLDTTSYQARNGSSFAISVLSNYASKTLRHSPVQDRRVRTLGMNLVSFFSSQSFGGVTFGNEFIGNHAYDVALIECRSIVSLASVRVSRSKRIVEIGSNDSYFESHRRYNCLSFSLSLPYTFPQLFSTLIKSRFRSSISIIRI